MPNHARHSNPAQRFPIDEYWKFESQFCAPPASSGRVGALIRSAQKLINRETSEIRERGRRKSVVRVFRVFRGSTASQGTKE